MAKITADPNQQREDKKRARLAALATTITRTDRILTGRSDVVFSFHDKEGRSTQSPAWNDGKRITVNESMIPSIESASGLVTCLGLNHHEVAHVLFTLGNHTQFVEDLIAAGEWKTYNLLEDMRIETLFSAQYISSKRYLTAPVLQFIVENESAWPTAHLLTYGRRYLPLEIRKEFRKRFAGDQALRTRAEQIIDEYRMLDLSDSAKHATARSLVAEMHALIGTLLPSLSVPQQNAMDDHSGCGGLRKFSNDRSKVARAERDAGRRRDDESASQEEKESSGEDGSGFYDDPDDRDDMADDFTDGESSDQGNGDSGRGEGAPDENGDARDTGSGGAAPNEGDDANTPGSSGGSASPEESGADDTDQGDNLGMSGGAGTGAPDGRAEIDDLVRRAVEAIAGDTEVKNEITRLRNEMANEANVDTLIKSEKYRENVPTPAAGSALHEATRELQQLKTKFEPGWEYGTDHGRVNVQRAMTADFGDTDIYDSWDEGREEDAALEAVIVIDNSASMRDMMGSASEAAWVIKRALDEVDALSTVFTFNTETRKLYGRGEKASQVGVRHVSATGGTIPEGAMKEARMILGESERPNKLFVIVTDGRFGGWGVDYHSLLESIPATRVFVGIDENVGPYSTSLCAPELEDCYDALATVQKPDEISAVIRAAVRSMLDEAYKGR